MNAENAREQIIAALRREVRYDLSPYCRRGLERAIRVVEAVPLERESAGDFLAALTADDRLPDDARRALSDVLTYGDCPRPRIRPLQLLRSFGGR